MSKEALQFNGSVTLAGWQEALRQPDLTHSSFSQLSFVSITKTLTRQAVITVSKLGIDELAEDAVRKTAFKAKLSSVHLSASRHGRSEKYERRRRGRSRRCRHGNRISDASHKCDERSGSISFHAPVFTGNKPLKKVA